MHINIKILNILLYDIFIKIKHVKQNKKLKNTIFFYKNRMFLGYNYDKVVLLNIGTDIIMSYK